MSEEENLLVRIKFIVDMYSSGATSAGTALEQILNLIDKRESEEQNEKLYNDCEDRKI